MTETPEPAKPRRPKNPRFRYTDNEGVSQQVGLTALARMSEVRKARGKPVGPARTNPWSAAHVRDAAKRGLWKVEWGSSDDPFDWVITGLTPLGRKVLDLYIEKYGEL